MLKDIFGNPPVGKIVANTGRTKSELSPPCEQQLRVGSKVLLGEGLAQSGCSQTVLFSDYSPVEDGLFA